MGRGLGFLLATAALAAAALVIVPLVLSRDALPECREPDHPEVSFTRAAASGSHVVGLTEFADGAPQTVHFVGLSGPRAVEDSRIRIRGGGTRTLRATDRPGCYVVDGSIPPQGSVLVTATTSEEEGIRARIDRERLPQSAVALLARSRRATAALTGLEERQRVGRRADARRDAVRVSYGATGYRVTSARGTFEQDVENWQRLFYWTDPSTFTSVSVIGRETLDGREVVRLAGFVTIPLWLEILVDPATGRVEGQQMLAAQHFMDSRFIDFRH